MTFYDIIYKWVTDNFGQSEAEEPSWNIEALAKHLSESDIDPEELNAYTKSRVFDTLDRQYLIEDIEYVAGNLGITLTKEELEKVIHNYYKQDSARLEQLHYIVKEIKGARQ